MDKELISMKNCNIKNLISLVVLFVTVNSIAQQDALFTQYMYNMSVINPAYATADQGVINFGGLYRTQWVGLEGAPKTGSFFAHTPLSEKIEVGISFVNDQIGAGIINENNVFADFAYIIPVSDDAKLSFGLKAGASFFNLNAANLTRSQQNDGAFVDMSAAMPNLGVGAFYFAEKYYIGFSAPNLFQTQRIESTNGIATTTQVQSVHYFLTSGYVFDLTPNLKYKPSFMLRSVLEAPVSFDINNNVLINEKFEVGIGYRLRDSFMGNFIFSVNPSLRIGYAYDYNTSNLGNFNSGSHEIMLLFNLEGLKQYVSYDKSPRFY
jgi:type IX secretion system PorP/SprF family membrane protein